MITELSPDFGIGGAYTNNRHLEDVGFRWGAKGTHTSRTIMLQELVALMACCPPDTSREAYLSTIIDDNCLAKRTASNRKLTSQRLCELYVLDRKILLFRVFRQLWEVSNSDHRVLALLLALARDPLLRATAESVLRLDPGQELSRHETLEAIRTSVGDRLNDSSVDKVLRNTASSWTQSGHLRGHSHKLRQAVAPTPVTTAYALLLGHLCGFRGHALFETFWVRVFDCTAAELLSSAADSRRLGLLDLTYGGGVVQVGFTSLLGSSKEWDADGKN